MTEYVVNSAIFWNFNSEKPVIEGGVMGRIRWKRNP
jgi:hypothetical protein